jgi:hypothetical protein
MSTGLDRTVGLQARCIRSIPAGTASNIKPLFTASGYKRRCLSCVRYPTAPQAHPPHNMPSFFKAALVLLLATSALAAPIPTPHFGHIEPSAAGTLRSVEPLLTGGHAKALRSVEPPLTEGGPAALRRSVEPLLTGGHAKALRSVEPPLTEGGAHRLRAIEPPLTEGGPAALR